MSFWRVDVGPIPQGCRGIASRWRAERSTLWTDLPRREYAPFVVELPDSEGPLVLEVTPVDAYGNAAGAPWSVGLDPDAPVKDRPAPKDEVFPDPEVRLDGGVLDVMPVAPVGGSIDEWDHEVRVSETAEAEHEAVFAGYAERDGRVVVNQWPVTAMKVHVRSIRRADRRRGAWRVVTVKCPAGDTGFAIVTDDPGTDLGATGWTIANFPPGIASAQFPGAGTVLRNAPAPSIWNTTPSDSIWGMNGDLSIWGCAEYLPFAEITSPAFDGGAVHEFLPVVHPEFGSQAFDDPCIWNPKADRGLVWPGRGERRAEPDERHDRYDRSERDRDTCMWNSAQGGDRGPVEIEKLISLSDDAAAYGAFEPLVEGRRYRARAYKLKVRIRSRRGNRQVSLSKLACHRWIRNRKWEFRVPIDVSNGDKTYTFSPVPEITNASALAAAVTILHSVTDSRISYEARVVSLSATAIRVLVTQVVRDQVVTSGGVVTWTYPAAFGATPRITCSPEDALQEAFAGFHTAGTTQATVYATDHTGAPVDKDVDCHAIGPPPSGALTALVVLTGY